jgi:predicted O-linked N-acetylglucosamine transferase (SPINDLY family)
MYRDQARVAEPPANRTGAVTFASFHKIKKLNDAVLDAWAALLKEVRGSRLLLSRDTIRGRTAERLLQRLVKRGVDPLRVALEAVTVVGMAHLAALGGPTCC